MPITEPAALKKSVILSLVRSVEQAAKKGQPFDHFYMQNCFPQDLYSQILAKLPDAFINAHLNHPDALTAGGKSTRKFFELSEASLSALDRHLQDFWLAISQALLSPEVHRAIFSKLSGDLCRRFNVTEKELLELCVYPRAGIFCDLPGYRIRPHPDNPVRFVTVQFYLPIDDSQRDFGTSIYKILKLRSYWNRLRGIKDDLKQYREVKRFPFMPNSGYAFAVSDKSYHGRPVIEGQASLRKSILLVYYDRPGVGYDALPAGDQTAATGEY